MLGSIGWVSSRGHGKSGTVSSPTSGTGREFVKHQALEAQCRRRGQHQAWTKGCPGLSWRSFKARLQKAQTLYK